jgi:hypothetical protein
VAHATSCEYSSADTRASFCGPQKQSASDDTTGRFLLSKVAEATKTELIHDGVDGEYSIATLSVAQLAGVKR